MLSGEGRALVPAYTGEMPSQRPSRRSGSYTSYSIASAAVWLAVWSLAGARVSGQMRQRLAIGCAGWWQGWLSATIARAVYPPPRLSEGRRASIRKGAIALLSIMGLAWAWRAGKWWLEHGVEDLGSLPSR